MTQAQWVGQLAGWVEGRMLFPFLWLHVLAIFMSLALLSSSEGRFLPCWRSAIGSAGIGNRLVIGYPNSRGTSTKITTFDPKAFGGVKFLDHAVQVLVGYSQAE